MSTLPPLPQDSRELQALRIADFLEARGPTGATAAEILKACDPGSVTKVISVMRKDMGYGIRLQWRPAVNRFGQVRRHGCGVYVLTHRPAPRPQAELMFEAP